jgi:hypothetical protein
VLVIREKALGTGPVARPEHLAGIYQAPGKYGGGGVDQARVGDPRKGVGREPPAVGGSQQPGFVYAAQRKYGEAEELYKRAGNPGTSARHDIRRWSRLSTIWQECIEPGEIRRHGELFSA